MRTIILVGKTGLGKTTFANYLAGSQLQTGSGVTSVTANPQPIVFKHNGVQHRVVDMPGFSDVRINSKEAITDEVIHRWILQEVVNNEVVGIVMFLSQEDVLGARLSKEFVAISEIMMTRFSGFESMCFFAISGKNMIGGMGDFIKAAMTVVTTGKLRIMGLGPDNWARCKKKDFARVKDWCLKRLQASEPRLVPRTTVDLCKRCGLRADPLLIDGPCRYHHESGELVHGEKTHRTHPQCVSNTHRGNWKSTMLNMCKGPWSCCGSKQQESVCTKMHFPCCGRDEKSQGCQEICNDCEKQTNQEGCQGSCQNCNQFMTKPGCESHDEHDWKGDIVPFKLPIEHEIINVPDLSEDEVDAFVDEYPKFDDQDWYTFSEKLFVHMAIWRKGPKSPVGSEDEGGDSQLVLHR